VIRSGGMEFPTVTFLLPRVGGVGTVSVGMASGPDKMLSPRVQGGRDGQNLRRFFRHGRRIWHGKKQTRRSFAQPEPSLKIGAGKKKSGFKNSFVQRQINQPATGSGFSIIRSSPAVRDAVAPNLSPWVMLGPADDKKAVGGGRADGSSFRCGPGNPKTVFFFFFFEAQADFFIFFHYFKKKNNAPFRRPAGSSGFFLGKNFPGKPVKARPL